LAHHLENEAFYSHILQANLDGKAQKVVLKDLQRHPAKPFVMHFDLLRVADTDRIKMNVPLHFLGEDIAPGVKLEGGQASHNLSDLEIYCQAKDLPEYIEVYVSAMNVGDVIHISELTLPEGVESVALSQGADALVVTMLGKQLEVAEEDEVEAAAEPGEESEPPPED